MCTLACLCNGASCLRFPLQCRHMCLLTKLIYLIFHSHNYLFNEDLRDQRPRSIDSDRWLLSDRSIDALDGDTLFAALQIIAKNMRDCPETNKQMHNYRRRQSMMRVKINRIVRETLAKRGSEAVLVQAVLRSR